MDIISLVYNADSVTYSLSNIKLIVTDCDNEEGKCLKFEFNGRI